MLRDIITEISFAISWNIWAICVRDENPPRAPPSERHNTPRREFDRFGHPTSRNRRSILLGQATERKREEKKKRKEKREEKKSKETGDRETKWLPVFVLSGREHRGREATLPTLWILTYFRGKVDYGPLLLCVKYWVLITRSFARYE